MKKMIKPVAAPTQLLAPEELAQTTGGIVEAIRAAGHAVGGDAYDSAVAATADAMEAIANIFS